MLPSAGHRTAMTGAADAVVFDRELLVRRRDRMAATAAHHDFLLARVADEIAERLSFIARMFPVAADIGAYHGVLARRLVGHPRIGTLVSAEASARLLAACPHPKLQADEELLAFGDGMLDLIVSGLSLQFVNDLPGTLVQIRRALKPDGLLLAGMLGGETLHELRQSFLIAESEIEGGASPRVAPFADIRDLGGLLQRAGFALPVTDSDLLTVTYASPLELMRELRAMAAANALVARRRTPLRRATLLRAAEVYRERFGRDGRIPATFEIVMLSGWVPHESQQKPLQPGSAKARLADALGVKERKAE